MDELTWTCHACGKKREDLFISVFTRDDSAKYGLGHGALKTNFRYCNDNPECGKIVREPDFDIRKRKET